MINWLCEFAAGRVKLDCVCGKNDQVKLELLHEIYACEIHKNINDFQWTILGLQEYLKVEDPLNIVWTFFEICNVHSMYAVHCPTLKK